jgi:Na+/H+-dicarboxylate symporter
MIATYIAIDSFGTATNVTGDGAIAVVMDKLVGKRGNADELAAEQADAQAVVGAR